MNFKTDCNDTWVSLEDYNKLESKYFTLDHVNKLNISSTERVMNREKVLKEKNRVLLKDLDIATRYLQSANDLLRDMCGEDTDELIQEIRTRHKLKYGKALGN